VDGATHQEQLLLGWVCLGFQEKNPIRWTRRQKNHFHALQSCTTIRTHVDAPAHVPPTSIVTVNRNALHERLPDLEGENKLGTIFLLASLCVLAQVYMEICQLDIDLVRSASCRK
jgi:hypothetical protein